MAPHTSEDDLLQAAKALRAAQRQYMAVRGRLDLPRAIIEEYGEVVAAAAAALDRAIEQHELPA